MQLDQYTHSLILHVSYPSTKVLNVSTPVSTKPQEINKKRSSEKTPSQTAEESPLLTTPLSMTCMTSALIRDTNRSGLSYRGGLRKTRGGAIELPTSPRQSTCFKHETVQETS